MEIKKLKNILLTTEIMDANQITNFISSEISATAIEKTEGTSLIGSIEILGNKTEFYASTSGGGSVTVDDEMSLTSTNPVLNKVITTALNSKVDKEKYIEKKEIKYGYDLSIEKALSANELELSSYGFFVKHYNTSNGKITFYSTEKLGSIPKKLYYTEDDENIIEAKFWNNEAKLFNLSFDEAVIGGYRIESITLGKDKLENDVFFARTSYDHQMFSKDGKNWVVIKPEHVTGNQKFVAYNEKLHMFAILSTADVEDMIDERPVSLCVIDDINVLIEKIKSGYYDGGSTPFLGLYDKYTNKPICKTHSLVAYDDGFIIILNAGLYTTAQYIAGIERYTGIEQIYTTCVQKKLNIGEALYVAGSSFTKGIAIGNGKLLFGDWNSITSKTSGTTVSELVIYDFETDTAITKDLPAGGIMAIRYIDGYFYIAVKGKVASGDVLFKTYDGSTITAITFPNDDRIKDYKIYNLDLDIDLNHVYLGAQGKDDTEVPLFIFKFGGDPEIILTDKDKILCKKDYSDALKQIGTLDYIIKQETDAATLSCLLDGFNYIIDALKNS